MSNGIEIGPNEFWTVPEIDKLLPDRSLAMGELYHIAEQMNKMGGEFFPSEKEMESYPLLKILLANLEDSDD